jgi:hypothetical protein
MLGVFYCSSKFFNLIASLTNSSVPPYAHEQDDNPMFAKKYFASSTDIIINIFTIFVYETIFDNIIIFGDQLWYSKILFGTYKG